jgi:dTDP-4-amino-4,6-dideoxygalactose transaminase
VYDKFVVRCPRRSALAAHLSQARVETKVHYPVPLHREPMFARNGDYKDQHYPNALRFADTVVTLPAHAFLDDGEIEAIVDAVRRFK